MKRPYISPALEVYLYRPEKGYSNTIGMRQARHRDRVLIEGDDPSSRYASDELTEYTEGGEFQTGDWEWE